MPKLNSKGTADCGDASSPMLHIVPEKCLSLCMKAKPSSQRSFQGRVLSERARTASHTDAFTSACKGPQKGTNGLLGKRRSRPPDPDTCHAALSRQIGQQHCPMAGWYHRLKGSLGFVCPTRSNLIFCSLNVMGMLSKAKRTHNGPFPKGRSCVEFLFLQHLVWCLENRVDVQEISVDVQDEKGH